MVHPVIYGFLMSWLIACGSPGCPFVSVSFPLSFWKTSLSWIWLSTIPTRITSWDSLEEKIRWLRPNPALAPRRASFTASVLWEECCVLSWMHRHRLHWLFSASETGERWLRKTTETRFYPPVTRSLAGPYNETDLWEVGRTELGYYSPPTLFQWHYPSNHHFFLSLRDS